MITVVAHSSIIFKIKSLWKCTLPTTRNQPLKTCTDKNWNLYIQVSHFLQSNVFLFFKCMEYTVFVISRVTLHLRCTILSTSYKQSFSHYGIFTVTNKSRWIKIFYSLCTFLYLFYNSSWSSCSWNKRNSNNLQK